jgi:hypothetical protein
MNHNIENITKLSLLAFKTEDIYVAYDLLHNYYRDKIGRPFPLRIEECQKEKKIAVELLQDLIIEGQKIEQELANPPNWFNLEEFKTLVTTAYQKLNFETAMIEFKARWKLVHNKPYPYPLWDYYDDFRLIVNELNYIIIENCLLKPKPIERINKTEIKKSYNWSEDMFRMFYPEPLQIINCRSAGNNTKTKTGISTVYDINKLEHILESEAYLMYVEKQRDI